MPEGMHSVPGGRCRRCASRPKAGRDGLTASNDVVPGLQLASKQGGQSTRGCRGLDLLTKVWLAEALKLNGPVKLMMC